MKFHDGISRISPHPGPGRYRDSMLMYLQLLLDGMLDLRHAIQLVRVYYRAPSRSVEGASCRWEGNSRLAYVTGAGRMDFQGYVCTDVHTYVVTSLLISSVVCRLPLGTRVAS